MDVCQVRPTHNTAAVGNHECTGGCGEVSRHSHHKGPDRASADFRRPGFDDVDDDVEVVVVVMMIIIK